MTWVCSVCTGTWTVSWTGVEWEVTTGCLWDASIVPGPRLGVATEPEQKEFSTSSQKDFLLLRARILLSSLLHVLACLSSYECCKCICGGKKYKGFVRLILQQGFVQRIAHGFVYMNVQGFVLCARSWWARRAAQGHCCTTSVINSVRQLPFCHQLYLSWPSIYQPP